MDDKPINSSTKAIIVEGNIITNIADSIDEYESSDALFIDVGGRSVVPGFIDAHNHLLWSGDRFNEHNLRMQGKSYADIAKMGGGIMETVRTTQQASDQELYTIGRKRMEEALRNGTTFMEAKSGYGLSTERELRLLNLVHNLKKEG